MSHLRRNEHVPTILGWVEQLINESPEAFLSAKDSANDFAFT